MNKHARFGVWIGLTLVAACGGKQVDLGKDPQNAATGGSSEPSSGGASSGGKAAASGGKATAVTGGRASTSSGGDSGGPRCGDGILQGDEACDDGNPLGGDGCDEKCSVEPGWSCVAGFGCGWLCNGALVASPDVCRTGECAAGTTPTPPEPPSSKAERQPCDIYADDGGPCVAAHSTLRALFATYEGPLYQVKKRDGTTKNIGPRAPGGFANADEQAEFCQSESCTISIIFDQSGWGNHLTKAPPGGAKPTGGNEANAAAVGAVFGGNTAYGLHLVPGVAYRNNDACGTATGDDPQTVYMVVAGDFYNGGCCFDYGNVERNSRDEGEGSVEAVYFGSTTIWGKGAGAGPWVMGDLENGLWAGNTSPYEGNPSLKFKYVTGMVKGDSAGKNHWTIKAGDAQTATLSKVFDGPRPSSRYIPMRKQGAIGLGAAGDNSNGAQGNFFEGVMTAHYSSDEADDAVQANVMSVYGSAH